MQVKIHQPKGYDTGAFRAEIGLDQTERDLVESFPGLTFAIPDLPERAIYPDDGYRRIVPTVASARVDGSFVKGKWFGHVYSNGVAEAENSTPIAAVEVALGAAVDVLLSNARSWRQE